MVNSVYYYIDQTSTIINQLDLDIDNVNLNQGYIEYAAVDTLSLLKNPHIKKLHDI